MVGNGRSTKFFPTRHAKHAILRHVDPVPNVQNHVTFRTHFTGSILSSFIIYSCIQSVMFLFSHWVGAETRGDSNNTGIICPLLQNRSLVHKIFFFLAKYQQQSIYPAPLAHIKPIKLIARNVKAQVRITFQTNTL